MQGSAVELRTQIYILREVNIFFDLDMKELIECNQNRTPGIGKNQNVTAHPYRHSGFSRNDRGELDYG